MYSKNAFFMIEVIISILLVSFVVGVIFEVRNTTSIVINKTDNISIEKQLLTSFLPYTKNEKNKVSLVSKKFKISDTYLLSKVENVTILNTEDMSSELVVNENKNSDLKFSSKRVHVSNSHYKTNFDYFVME